MTGEISFRFRLPLAHFDLSAEAVFPGRGATAIFGRSGCGKTRLLRCFAGLETPPEAYLSVNGEVWHDSSRGLYRSPPERGVGYVFQEGALFGRLKVRDNLLYGFRRTHAPQRSESLERVVALLGLERLLEVYPSRLSGGEKQRVAIGRALLNNPALMLMDEPMASLDRNHKREILPYLEALQAETRIPILYVTHDPDELVRVADHLALVDDGRLIASGPLDEMLTSIDLPLARDVEAGAVVHATVVAKDDVYHLTELAFAGGRLTAEWTDRPLGSRVRLRVQARDVSLTLSEDTATTVQNRLPARILDMQGHGRGRMVIKLGVGDVALLARITRRSAARLELQPGMEVYAQVKAVALLGGI